MTRLSLLLAAAATVAAAVVVQSPAEARDGCPQGWRNYGYGCVQLGGPFDDGRYGGPGYYGGRRYYDRGSYYAPNFRGNTVRPIRGNNGAISCSNRNYTWQNGACRPYRGG
jgi:hypothetical protein